MYLCWYNVLWFHHVRRFTKALSSCSGIDERKPSGSSNGLRRSVTCSSMKVANARFSVACACDISHIIHHEIWTTHIFSFFLAPTFTQVENASHRAFEKSLFLDSLRCSIMHSSIKWDSKPSIVRLLDIVPASCPNWITTVKKFFVEITSILHVIRLQIVVFCFYSSVHFFKLFSSFHDQTLVGFHYLTR